MSPPVNVPASLPNPFHGNVMEDPWKKATVDVAKIHGSVFENCCSAVEYVRRFSRSAGILIHGQAGSGKTHLLGRLREHLADESPHVELDQSRHVFISVRLSTNPNHLWRHVRRRFVDDLLRRMPDGLTQLEHVLATRLASRCGGEGDLSLWWDYMREERRQDLEDQLADICEENRLSTALNTVLEHLIRRTCRRPARAWLRGESLTQAALEQLGLPPVGEEADEQLDPEMTAQDVAVSLCRLAAPQVPIVFCFDQVEALERDPSDRTGLRRFGKLLSDLHDQTSNCVLISCIQSQYLEKLKSVDEYARDRIHSRANTSLRALTFEEASDLVAARLEASHELRRLRPNNHDRLWPLTEEGVRRLVGDTGCTPRELIAFCADRFTEQQGGTVRKVDIENDFLPQVWQERLEAAIESNSSDESDHILADGLPSLIETATDGWTISDSSTRDIDLVLTAPQREAQVGVSFCTQRNMTSLAGRLRRLREQLPENKLQKLVLIRDPRIPITQTARKARSYLKELEQQDAVLYRPTPEVLAALDALRQLLADSESGDLAVSGTTVPAQTVQKWLADHLSDSLADARDMLIGYPRPHDFGQYDLDQLIEILEQRHVASLSELADELNRPVEELASILQEDRARVGYLPGHPGVVFELV